MNIEERITRLELSNRRWQRLAACLGAVAAALIVAWLYGSAIQPRVAKAADTGPATVLDEMRARKLVIVNAEGKNVIELNGGKNSEPAICRFVTEEGKNAIELIGGKVGGAIVLSCPEDEKCGLTLTTGRQQTAIALRDEKGGFDVSGVGLSISSEKLAPLVALGQTEGPGGIVQIYSALGKIVASIQASKTNQGLVGVSDVDGKLSNALLPR